MEYFESNLDETILPQQIFYESATNTCYYLNYIAKDSEELKQNIFFIRKC